MDIANSIIGLIGTILGGLGVFLTLNSNKRDKELKTIDWSSIHCATKYFWKMLKKRNFTPTFIITPGQKGGIIAQLIKDFYKNDIPIFTGFLESAINKQIDEIDYLALTTTKWHIYLPISLKNYKDKSNVKLLIVDDFVMSGDFLYTLQQTLLDLGYQKENIYSCTIAVTKVAIDANKAPDFYWKIVNDKEFYFPWGKAE